jgi:hypothetical protein
VVLHVVRVGRGRVRERGAVRPVLDDPEAIGVAGALEAGAGIVDGPGRDLPSGGEVGGDLGVEGDGDLVRSPIVQWAAVRKTRGEIRVPVQRNRPSDW